MTHATAPFRPLRRRLAGSGALLAILVLVALGLVGGARPAAATNEFPPNPAASVETSCTPDGLFAATSTLTMTNVGGADTAHFTVGIVGRVGTKTFDVAPDTTAQNMLGLVEGDTATFHTTEANGFVQDDVLGPINCTDYHGEIVLSCNGNTPTLTATYSNKSYVDSDVTLAAGGSSVVAPTDQKQEPLTLEVADHQPFSASLSTKLEGTFATLEGTPNCVPPVTTSTTSTVPTSVISVNTPAPPVAHVALARTGTNSWPLAGVGITLIGLGVAFRRRAARLA